MNMVANEKYLSLCVSMCLCVCVSVYGTEI